MKLQDFLVPLLFSFTTIWLLTYLWGPKPADEQQVIRSGQEFSVMKSVQMCYPVNTEVDFYDAHKGAAAEITEVAGYQSYLRFSSGGAVLDSLAFKRDLAGVEGVIVTTAPSATTERARGTWLVALQEMTPYDFKLVDKQEREHERTLTYESTTKQAKITKQFVISLTTYQVDCVVTVEPLVKDSSVQPRLFVPGPYMTELGEYEKISAVVFTDRESLKKVSPEQTIDVAWASPRIFGAEDRYFLYALVQDKDHFTQRAYFKQVEGNRLAAILEGPMVKEKTTWTLSFYCGPKEAHQLVAVDKRLESVMDYGWLAPISKLLLFLLTFIYSYIHNYGWAIIILTLLMRLIMLPFAQRGKRKLKAGGEISQKLKYIEQKYKDNPEALQEARAELMRKQGMTMFGGCLPVLIQLPVFIGLNFALRNSIELYQAPFIFWIRDLSAKDPYYVIPSLIGVTSFLALSASSKDPRHKVAMLFVSLLIAGATAYLSAGLGLFIAVSSLLGVLENRMGQGN